MTRWLIGISGGITASVIAGVIVWWLTSTGGPIGPAPAPTPTTQATPTPTPALTCAMTLLFDAERVCTLDVRGPGVLTIGLEPNLRVPWSISISGLTAATVGCEMIGDFTPTGPTSFADISGGLDLRCQVPSGTDRPRHDLRFLVRSPQAANFDVQANVTFRP